MTPIRPASAPDAASIAEIERTSAHRPWSLDAIERVLQLPTTRAFVAHAPGAGPVGHLIASACGDTGEVLTLAVSPRARRRGLAGRLMDACEQTWHAEGVQEAFLEVRADNAAARALYGGRSWAPVGTRRGYYDDGTDAVVLRWSTR